jgi:allophanate hydrolase subunit 2
LFFTSEWGITPQLNRMGFRLTGPALSHKASADILSDGIVCGSIQVPGDGQPIIMMRDHQTTGGYTKMATVISADLAPLARMRPGLFLRFNAISQEEAEDIARQKEDKMRTLLASLRPV